MRRCLGKEVRQVKRRKRKADENTIDTVSNVVEFCIPEPDHHADRIRKFTECLGKGIMQMCPEYGLTAPALEAPQDAGGAHVSHLPVPVSPVGAAGVHVPGRPVPPGLAQFLRRRAHLRSGGFDTAGPVSGPGPAVSGGHGGPVLAGGRVPGGDLAPRVHRPAGPGNGDADGWNGPGLDSVLERRFPIS